MFMVICKLSVIKVCRSIQPSISLNHLIRCKKCQQTINNQAYSPYYYLDKSQQERYILVLFTLLAVIKFTVGLPTYRIVMNS